MDRTVSDLFDVVFGAGRETARGTSGKRSAIKKIGVASVQMLGITSGKRSAIKKIGAALGANAWHHRQISLI